MTKRKLDYWLNYLESLPSGLANRSLDRVRIVAKRLGLLDSSSAVIKVAGTNGKSSTVVLLESILRAAGFNVGAYISPHVERYNERIRLDGKDIDDQTLCWAFTQVEMARVGADIDLSYFEFSTLAALIIFKREPLDFLILEVGLGGRFDAVNVLDANLAVITTISLDHTEVLGIDRESIGYEKAGVIRPGKPVVCGADMPESVYVAAKSSRSKIYGLDKEFSFVEKDTSWVWSYEGSSIDKLPLVDLPLSNAALALMVIKLLAVDFDITKGAILEGLERAFLPGRFQQIIFKGKNIIFDVAHNLEATELLIKKLTKAHNGGQILAVSSMLRDKDIEGMLGLMKPFVDQWYLGVLKNKRGAKKSQMLECLQSVDINNFTFFSDVTDSLHRAIAECQEKDTIVLFGSFYTVAEGMKLINR